MTDLLSSLSLSPSVTAANRIWLAPMTNMQSHEDGTLGEDELVWLMRRARGGFGVIESCASHVAKDGQGWEGELGCYSDEHLPGLTKLATALKETGTVALVQLFHGGLRANAALTGQPTWSASAYEEPGLTTPRAATEEDITRVIGQFREAAIRCDRAGWHGVELHGAHGYLLGQFLSSAVNQRTDGWGGTFEKRARLLREVTRAVRAATRPGFVVGVRISPEDWGQAKGLDLDESLQLASWLAEDGIDFLHASLWSASKNTKKRPESHPLPLFRAALPAHIRLVVAGSIWTRAEGEELLRLGADAIALGRSAILNPEWPQRITDPTFEPARPPTTVAALREASLSEKFAGYMRIWKNFVAD
jgi:2,4-dienoyl-CoA reductase-like NADH-dependent reductase (Old Yellow Enzyme family)